jgi:hypothetical protein
MPRRRTAPQWIPSPGELATYTGRYGRLLRDGRIVRVVAEAACLRTIVEAIGYKGKPVRLTVKTKHLDRLQPGIFDYAGDELCQLSR